MFSLRSIGTKFSLLFLALVVSPIVYGQAPDKLDPSQMNFAGGACGSLQYYSPFDDTCHSITAVGAPNMAIHTSSYTASTCGQFVRMDNTSAATVTLPASIATGCKFAFMRKPGAAAVTINPNGLSYDGATTLQEGQTLYIDTDGTGYHANAEWFAGSGCSITPSLTGNSFTCGGSAPTLASIVALWTSCTSGYLKYDGTCSTPSGGGSGTNTWERKGTVLSPTAVGSNGYQEPQVLYNVGSPVILTNAQGPVWKMWYSDGWASSGCNYAESLDGKNYTQYSGNPIATSCFHPGIAYSSGTYYLYYNPSSAATQINVKSASDGVTFGSASTALSLGSGGSWEDSQIANAKIMLDGSTWRMYYEGRRSSTGWSTGMATASSAGGSWTKDVSNPVAQLSSGTKTIAFGTVVKIGSNFYTWAWRTPPSGTSSINLPTDGYFWSSPDAVTWSQANSNISFLFRRTLDEGANVPSDGQVADFSVVEANGVSYLYYTATYSQAGTGQDHIKVAQFNDTLANIVATTQTDTGTQSDATPASPANTMRMNASGSVAPDTDVTLPTCTTGADLYNTTTHTWSCVSTGGGSGNYINACGSVTWTIGGSGAGSCSAGAWTVTTAGAGMTISGIPAGVNLLVSFNGQTANSVKEHLQIQLNGDTATDYNVCELYTTGTSGAAQEYCNNSQAFFFGAIVPPSSSSHYSSSSDIIVKNYAGATFFKQIWSGGPYANSSGGTADSELWSTTWTATPQAITIMKLFYGSGANFPIGTTFSIYYTN